VSQLTGCENEAHGHIETRTEQQPATRNQRNHDESGAGEYALQVNSGRLAHARALEASMVIEGEAQSGLRSERKRSSRGRRGLRRVTSPAAEPNVTTMQLPPLYAIADEETARRCGWRVPDLAGACLAGGARFLQVRAKTAPSGAFLRWCQEIRDAGRRSDALVVVNDRFDVALMSGLSAIHVGQDDLAPATVRRWLGEGGTIGLSTHTREQVDRALDEPISYLAVGPVFGTRTKETGYEGVGLSLVEYAAGRAGAIPVVAIGGITLANAGSVLDAGAASVAVISDLLATDDPVARVREFEGLFAHRRDPV
jgi:thiamine-phosphate pyrophosphorylase